MFNRAYSYFFSAPENPPHQVEPHPLLAAAKFGNLPAMSRIMNFSPNIDVRDEQGNTPLILAASQNQVTAVRMLINNGAQVETKGENGFTALHVAAYFGHIEAATLLISKGANIENRLHPYPGSVGASATPLWSAVRNGHANMVRLLIAVGANVNAVDGDHNPLLVYAVSLGNFGIVSMLAQAGADASLLATNGHNAVSLAAECQRYDLLQLLTSDRHFIDERDDAEGVKQSAHSGLQKPVEQPRAPNQELQPVKAPQQVNAEQVNVDQPVPAELSDVDLREEQEIRARRLQFFAKNGLFNAAVRTTDVRTNNPQRVSRAV